MSGVVCDVYHGMDIEGTRQDSVHVVAVVDLFVCSVLFAHTTIKFLEHVRRDLEACRKLDELAEQEVAVVRAWKTSFHDVGGLPSNPEGPGLGHVAASLGPDVGGHACHECRDRSCGICCLLSNNLPNLLVQCVAVLR